MKVFLSCVSSEFRSYRLKLANQLGALKGQPCEVKVQEDFEQGGFTLLDKLADYIRACDLVIHIVGDVCGARPTAEHVRALFAHLGLSAPEPLPERSYTQWEFDLAQRFERPILCYFAAPEAPRDCGLTVEQPEAEVRLQAEHRARIEVSGKHYEIFSSHAELVRRVFYDLHLEADLKINNLPYKSLGTLFKGRKDFLEQLHKTLGEAEHRGHQRAAAITATATAATVYGLGGIGKTRAALEYAHRYADEYTALLFVQADSPSGLQQNLASLCGPMVLDLAEKDARETEVQVAAVLDWLQRHPGWFLILDNVDTEEAATAVQALLARLTRAGQVVITSRLGNWEGAVETLALDVLSVEAAADFLLERTEGGSNKQGGRRKQPDDAAQARVLAVELGQLALALEQAGAYIVRYKSTFAGYLEEWRQRHERVLAWFDERTMQYPRSVAVTWQTSFDRLNEPARRLLRLLSWLAPDPIPESLLEAAGGPFATSTHDLAGNGKIPSGPQEASGHDFSRAENASNSTRALAPEERNSTTSPESPISSAASDPRDALAELAAHSLVKRSDEEPFFSVHRLVQDVTRRTLPEADKLPTLKQALHWINNAFVGDPTDVYNWPVLELLLPHARSVATSADKQGVAGPTARLLNQAAQLLNARAQYRDAEPLFIRVLAIYEATHGDKHEALATSLNNLAGLFWDTNRLNEAEPLLRRALAIEEREFGPNHPNIAVDLNNLATLLGDINRLAEAEPLMRRALTIDERSFGPDHPDVARDLNNLAELLRATNRLAEAEPLLRRVISILEADDPDRQPNYSGALNNLGALLQATNRLAEAEPLMRRALEIEEQSCGPDHPNVAICLNNLAGLLCATNRLAEAEPLMRRALVIDERSLGPGQPEVARDLNNLAELLRATNRLAEAEPLYRRALAIDERSYGPDHPNVATDLNNLAQLLQATNRMAAAEPLMRRAVEIFLKFTRATGHPHPHLQDAVNNYVALLQARGRSEEQIQATLREMAPEFFSE